MTAFPIQSKYVPKGWNVCIHRFDPQPMPPEEINLCSYGRQLVGSWEEGHDILKYVSKPLSAETLDYFLDNPYLIPTEWKGKVIFFWGTIYEVQGAHDLVPQQISNPQILFVRCLLFSYGKWGSEFLSLDDEFGPTRVSAELPSRRSLWVFIKSLFKK